MWQIIWRRRVKTLPQYLMSTKGKNFVRSDDHLDTHYSFESATALLAVRNTINVDVEEENEGEKGARKIRTH
jgi:hypothetical protein